jgi:hypothetical protein
MCVCFLLEELESRIGVITWQADLHTRRVAIVSISDYLCCSYIFMFIIVIGIKIANPSTSLHSEGNAILETKS